MNAGTGAGRSAGFAAPRAVVPETRILGGTSVSQAHISVRTRRPRCARRSRTQCALPPPIWSKEKEKATAAETQEYIANVGSVIDSLRSDYPMLPHDEPSLALYCDYVTLRSPAGFICQGKSAYRAILWLMRTQLRMFFQNRRLVVLGLYHDREADEVYVRWRFSGFSRVAPAGTPAFVYDGLSIYSLNEQGHISDHTLDNIMRVRRSIRPLFESVLAAASVAHMPGVAAPVPARAPLARFIRVEERETVETKQVARK